LKIILRYGILILCIICQGCSCNKQKKLDRRVSLWRMDRIPYGTKYAYENLKYIFPHAGIRTGTRFPVLFQNESREDTTRVLMILSPKFAPEPEEMQSIIGFAASGNQVFISALLFDDTVMDMLHQKWNGSIYGETDNPEISLLDPVHRQWVKYSYPGYFSHGYFQSIDSAHTRVLGRDSKGKPDFIRISYAQGGAIFIHLNPFALSNFFLLYRENHSYYDLALSWLPANAGIVEWSDYFRFSPKADHFSALRFILSNRSLRWAFWLTMGLFLLMFLVEFKRKQRPVAEIPALRNASEDFVKTVGRLYFEQKNNQNLAVKMVAAFLENIRSAYNLSTSALNDEFAYKLAFRTGRPVDEINHLIQLIHSSRLNPFLSDQELMDLHRQISQFNKRVS
jgi:hypothetical protein